MIVSDLGFSCGFKTWPKAASEYGGVSLNLAKRVLVLDLNFLTHLPEDSAMLA